MKSYTKTGDDGTTGLFGGRRVAKTDLRVEAYGTVDELNSALGVARAQVQNTPADALDALIARIQTELFVLGADLATPSDNKALIDRLNTDQVEALEGDIDRYEAELEPLTQFILPGGSLPGAWLHLARTICRRAERRCVDLDVQPESNLGDAIVPYLNRLPDLLFVLGRYANHLVGGPETPWVPARKQGKGSS